MGQIEIRYFLVSDDPIHKVQRVTWLVYYVISSAMEVNGVDRNKVGNHENTTNIVFSISPSTGSEYT